MASREKYTGAFVLWAKLLGMKVGAFGECGKRSAKIQLDRQLIRTYSVQGIVGGSSGELEVCRMGSPPSRGLRTLKSRENTSTDHFYSDKSPLTVP